MGAIDLRNILGFLSQPNVMKTWLQTFSNQKTFFSKQYYFIDKFRMFFSKSENEVWMELKPDGCCCKNLKHYYSRKCTLNQSYEKVLHFSVTNGMKNAWISKFAFDFFTERDGLIGYFWLQFIEKGLISQMCNGFLFMKASSWKSSYFASE